MCTKKSKKRSLKYLYFKLKNTNNLNKVCYFNKKKHYILNRTILQKFTANKTRKNRDRLGTSH